MSKNWAIWFAQRILVPKLKNQVISLLEITDSICKISGCLPIGKHHSSYSLDILQTQYRELVFLGMPYYTHMKELSQIDVFMYV